MNSKNKELYEKAKNAIVELFSDRSVSIQECIDNLSGLIDEINVMIDSLRDDNEW